MNKPFYEVLRPTNFDEVIGQSHLVGENGLIRRLVENDKFFSMVLWGPPGSGKTSIARIVATKINFKFVEISAIFSGVADLRKIFSQAQEDKKVGINTILFVDEIHRFNKSQQDSFLPFLENGDFILVGATTENPSFELNNALLSRLQIYKLDLLSYDELYKLVSKIELSSNLLFSDAVKDYLISICGGDARFLINSIDVFNSLNISGEIDIETVKSQLHKKFALFDKNKDNHYNMLSCFHKSLRGSDVNASLFWMGKMLEAGEDPKSIFRRMLCVAYEDVGLADPNASMHALNGFKSYELLGEPEGLMAMSQVCIYLATCPKSNNGYMALKKSQASGKQYSEVPPPLNILNAPTKMMSDMGYNQGYKYDHNYKDNFSGQDFWPENMTEIELYTPGDIGFEKEIKKRKLYYDSLRKKINNGKD